MSISNNYIYIHLSSITSSFSQLCVCHHSHSVQEGQRSKAWHTFLEFFFFTPLLDWCHSVLQPGAQTGQTTEVPILLTRKFQWAKLDKGKTKFATEMKRYVSFFFRSTPSSNKNVHEKIYSAQSITISNPIKIYKIHLKYQTFYKFH